MTAQRLHPSLAAIDLLTKNELTDSLHSQTDRVLRDQYRTMKLMRIPPIRATATGVALVLAQAPDGGTPTGPEQGFIWRLGRVTVASNGADAGAVTLYVGSDPTALDISHQIDNGLVVGKAYYPGSRGVYLLPGEFIYASLVSVNGNQYAMTGQAVEVAAEMIGKIL
jgi:hypothetical protein